MDSPIVGSGGGALLRAAPREEGAGERGAAGISARAPPSGERFGPLSRRGRLRFGEGPSLGALRAVQPPRPEDGTMCKIWGFRPCPLSVRSVPSFPEDTGRQYTLGTGTCNRKSLICKELKS